MPNGVTRFGTMSAPSVSTIPRPRTMRSVGIITTWKGTMSVARISMKATLRPTKRILARA